MHLNHKPGEIVQVDWAGDTAAIVESDTGEIILAYSCLEVYTILGMDSV